MKVKQKKKKPTNKHKESLKEIWRQVESDIDYLQYIITCEEPIETKIDMLFSLHNCLSNRNQKLAEIAWE